MITEVAVIGAGPAGLTAARVAASEGFNTTVFEEHHRVGVPCHCAGMLSVEGLEKLGVAPGSFVQNTVYGGRVYAPDGSCVEIRDRRPRAYIIDRSVFDQTLADYARDAGADIHLNHRVDGLSLGGATPRLKLGEAAVDPRVVLDCEGATGRLIAAAGYPAQATGLIHGFNTELEAEVDSDLVELWFSEENSKGLFTWVIPLQEGRVRCGLGTMRQGGLESLKRFVWKRFGVEAGRVSSGFICTGGPVPRTVYPGALLVGDVAGQVKATTGGGVVIGGLCAGIAGKAAAGYLEGVDSLGSYERAWRREYEFELKSMHALRRFMNRLSDERLNRLLHGVEDAGLMDSFRSLVEEGDMDMQSGVISRALSNPGILAALLKLTGRVALDELLALFR